MPDIMLDYMRVRACPRCRWNLSGGHTEPEPGCPVCRGQPVTCIVIWNEAFGRVDITNAILQSQTQVPIHPDDRYLPRLVVEAVVAAAPRVAADLLLRPASCRGPIVEAADSEDVERMTADVASLLKGGE